MVKSAGRADSRVCVCVQLPSAAATGMGNPTAMLDGMKGNVAYMVQNMFMITW